MATVIEQVAFVAELLEFLPENEPGMGTVRLKSWLENSSYSFQYRQLQRYLLELEEGGWVARTTDGRADFWLRRHRGTQMLTMSRERAFALQLIQNKLQHVMPAQILTALKEEFKLAADKLSQHHQHDKAWMGKLADAPPLLSAPDIHPDVFSEISKALLEEKWLNVSYCSRNQQNKTSLRQLMPLGLVSREGVYYLVAQTREHDAVRQFRLDRISLPQTLDEPFTPPADFKLVDYLDGGSLNYPNGGQIALVLQMKKQVAEHLYETKLAGDQQIISLNNDWVRVSATVQQSQRLIWWILGLGGNVVLESPESLRQEIKEKLEEACLHYKSEVCSV